MRLGRCFTPIAALVAAGMVVWLAAAQPNGQVPAGATTSSPTDRWTPPRTPWHDPDLQGIWSAGYILTPLERPAEYGDKEFLTDEEVAALWAPRVAARPPPLGPTPLPREAHRARLSVGSAPNPQPSP